MKEVFIYKVKQNNQSKLRNKLLKNVNILIHLYSVYFIYCIQLLKRVPVNMVKQMWFLSTLVFAQQLTWLKKKTCWHLHPSWELSYFCPDIVSDPHIHIYNVQWIWKFTYMRFMAFNTYMSTEIYFILYLRVLLTVITLYLSVWWCVKWLGIGYTL